MGAQSGMGEFRGFDLAMARPTAELWVAGKDLSLGDRACLALAKVTDATAITANGRWVIDGLGVDVRLIR